MERLPKTAGAGPLADYQVGQRVMTREGFPGVITDIHEAPADLTTYWVTLDNDMGGGEYAEAEIWPAPSQPTAQLASVEHTAADDYPELGSILTERPPLEIRTVGHVQIQMTAHVPFADLKCPSCGTHPQEWEVDYFEDDSVTCSNCGTVYDFYGQVDEGGIYPRTRSAKVAYQQPGETVHVNGEVYTVVLAPDNAGALVVTDSSGTQKVLLQGELDEHAPMTFGASLERPFVREAGMIPPLPEWAILGQFEQYPQSGPEGVSYFKGEIDADRYVDCLLYFKDGRLVGVLNHFPQDMGPERKGNVLILIHPEYRRQGIATALWVEAKKRWNVKAQGQDTTPDGSAFLSKQALYLPPKPVAEQGGRNEAIAPEQQQGYDDGFADGKQGITRDPENPTDEAYRSGYEMGWAEGVEVNREPGNPWDSNDLADEQVAGLGHSPVASLLQKSAGAWIDWAKGKPRQSPAYTDIGRSFSYDWCRFRREHHCWLPKQLNEEASRIEGYAVWVPEDRGFCPRMKWEDQQKCPTSEPGPRSGSGGFTDATVPYEEGGQRGGRPSPYTRNASIEMLSVGPHAFVPLPPANQVCAVCDVWRFDQRVHPDEPSLTQWQAEQGLAATASDRADFGFHVTARWADIRSKAKRIRSEGGVRLIAANDGTVVGHVKGDTGVYETELVSSPGKRNVAYWACGCKWASYSWGRSGPWKKYEGRMCSHALALQYEAQSRGAFGREMTLDEKQPSWMDGKTVRQPGEYDKDQGSYGRPGNPDQRWWRKSHLRPATSQHDDDPAPVTLLAHSMLSEGRKYAEVKAMLTEHGVDDAPRIVREARSSSFMGKVRGLIKRLMFDGEGKIRDERGQEVAPQDVLYPGYHPNLGLNFRESQKTALSEHSSFTEMIRQVIAGGGFFHDPEPNEHDVASDIVAGAKAMLLMAQRVEGPTTSKLVSLAQRTGAKFAGLDFRYKTQDSLERKIASELHEFNGDAAQTAFNISDALRYTFILPFDTYTQVGMSILEDLERSGYRLRVKNYWGRGDAYNGINIACHTPNGFPFELQFHTAESFRMKEEVVHPIYKEYRKPSTTPAAKSRMAAEMRDLFDSIRRPLNVQKIGPQRSQDKPGHVPGYRPAPVSRWAKVASGSYRFLLLSTLQGTPTTVLREYLGADDHTVEIWVSGEGWVLSPGYESFIFMGEPRSEEISEDEANEFIESMSREASMHSRDDEFGLMFALAASLDAEGEVGPSLPRTGSSPSVHTAVADDEWGFEPSYTGDDVVWSGPMSSGTYHDAEMEFGWGGGTPDHLPLHATETLDDDPDAALPVTYGDDEDEAARQVAAALGASEATSNSRAGSVGSSETPEQRGARLLAQHEARLRGEEVPGPDPFGHVMAGQDDRELRAAAQQYLSKSALKDFTPIERKQIIDEGMDVQASNLDRLDIKGTHYEALEAASKKAASLADAEDMWMMDGDLYGEG